MSLWAACCHGERGQQPRYLRKAAFLSLIEKVLSYTGELWAMTLWFFAL